MVIIIMKIICNNNNNSNSNNENDNIIMKIYEIIIY